MSKTLAMRMRILLMSDAQQSVHWRRGGLWLLIAIGVGLAFGLPLRAANIAKDREELSRFLMQAVGNGEKKTLSRLFAAGVSVNYRCYYDERPGLLASWMIRLHLQHGPDCGLRTVCLGNPLLMQVGSFSKEMTKFLLDYGADPNVSSDQGMTALHLAAIRDERETAKLLILNGAHLEPRADDGATPLMLAREWNNTKMEQLLLQAGAKR